ncbi:MAG: response regulator transcription factor [Marinobacter sp.]|nr:response regulator transcription factor [Marinobacter sp.]
MRPDKRIALIDDHKLVRAGLSAIMNSLDGYHVDCQGSTGEDAIRIVQTRSPDILVMDVSMPKLCGIEALKQIRAQDEQLPILMLSMHDSPEFVISALEHGANGYILKDSAEQELKLALDYASRKSPYLSPPVAEHLIDRALSAQPITDVTTQLTRRQQEVLNGIAKGLSSREIADALGVSIKTVEAHRSQMMQRLGLKNGVELVRLALGKLPD